MNNLPPLYQPLADELKRLGFIRTPLVESAFRNVPRHLFLPGVPLEEVYQNQAIITKRIAGKPVSSSSEPAMMAIMLEQLGLQPGHRVLEIGAGTGFNAALMSHIVGETGQIITVDIDTEIAEAARKNLAAAGFNRVQVICEDGGNGYATAAPYDRIILTVGAWDITPAWREQLKPNGRLLLPLSLKTRQVSVAFKPAGNHLVSLSIVPCGFMQLRGAFAKPKSNIVQGLVEKIFLYKILPSSFINWMAFGRFSLENLRIRVYPHNTAYIPDAGELVVVKRWTKLVIDFNGI